MKTEAPRPDITNTRLVIVRYVVIAVMATGVGAAISVISFTATDLAGRTSAQLLVQFVGGVFALTLLAMIIMRGMAAHPPGRGREWGLAFGAALTFTALMAIWATVIRDRPPGFGLYSEQPWWMNLERSQAPQREILVRGWQFGFAVTAAAFYLVTRPRRAQSASSSRALSGESNTLPEARPGG